MAVVAYAHIELHGEVPFIAGTSTRVAELAKEHMTVAHDPAELHRRHPELSMGQIHGALAYYFDHQCEVDAGIEEERKVQEELRLQHGDFTALLRQKLRSQGLGAS
jgi:uncharacterized protein (DUF433 family)